MFGILYNLISALSPIMLRIIGVFNPRIKAFLEQRNTGQRPSIQPKKYWIHCSSLGEYEMAIPIIEKLFQTNNHSDFIITFFSPSGYNQAIKGKYKYVIMYLPLDTKKNVKAFYSSYLPEKALFIRYDLWYNYISEGIKLGTEFYLINGRFTAKHKIFTKIGRPYLKLLNSFKGVFVSDKNSYKTLKNNDITRVLFTGDTRVDRVIQLKAMNKDYPDIKEFKSNRKLLIIGSSWNEEEELLLELLERNIPDLAVIIAPHDIERSNQIKNRFKAYNAKLYCNDHFNENDKVLIINTIGMLSSIYKYADFVLVGGGFSGALHNIFEPAVFGNFITFGPNISKFPEAQDFVDKGFGYSIEENKLWIDIILELTNSNDQLEKLSQLSVNFVDDNKGATEAIISGISESAI